MILEPMGDNIIIELPMEERTEITTESGIVLPKTARTDAEARQDIATIVAVGEGRLLNNGQLVPLRVKTGNKVLFNKYAGTQIIVGDKKYLILKECDILAIIKD
jgi:chaperonin GroES